MNFFHSMATKVRQRIFCRSVRQQTQTLDPVLRMALVQDIGQDETELEVEFHRVEQELEQAKQALVDSEARETFLGQRLRRYRTALGDRAATLRQEQREIKRLLEQRKQPPQSPQQQLGGDQEDDANTNAVIAMDEEENLEERQAQLEQRLEKWEKDEDALVKIKETHVQIMAECERMRRKIKALEDKREECRTLSLEVGEFIHAAAGQEDNDDPNSNEPYRANITMRVAETEMSHLVVPAGNDDKTEYDNHDNNNNNKENDPILKEATTTSSSTSIMTTERSHEAFPIRGRSKSGT